MRRAAHPRFQSASLAGAYAPPALRRARPPHALALAAAIAILALALALWGSISVPVLIGSVALIGFRSSVRTRLPRLRRKTN